LLIYTWFIIAKCIVRRRITTLKQARPNPFICSNSPSQCRYDARK